jgi:hypothetical protein
MHSLLVVFKEIVKRVAGSLALVLYGYDIIYFCSYDKPKCDGIEPSRLRILTMFT